MRRIRGILLGAGFLLTSVLALKAQAQDNHSLKLVQTIPMPGVQGSLDHLGVDVKGKRLFATATKQNTVEVIDLNAGKRVSSIPGQSSPHSVFYSPNFKKLFVSNGDGTCKIFRGDDLKLIDSLPVGSGANDSSYDPTTKYFYVGVGDGLSGALAIVDTHSNQHIGDIKTAARPVSIMFEKSGPRMFMRLAGPTGSTRVGVVDRKKREEIAVWPVKGTENNGALTLDQTHQRLFIGSRKPPVLIVLDTDSGKQITQLESVSNMNDVWYDAAHKRIYGTGADGIAIYEQQDADHYTPMVKVASEPGAQTSIWVPEFNRLYVAAPQQESRDAEILVYEPQS